MLKLVKFTNHDDEVVYINANRVASVSASDVVGNTIICTDANSEDYYEVKHTIEEVVKMLTDIGPE